MIQQLQEKSTKINELSSTIDSLTSDITGLKQDIEEGNTARDELQAEINTVSLH